MSDINSIFPDDFASNKEKKSIEYGAKVGEAISNQWFNNSYISLRRQWINECRAYSRGEQTTDYKSMIEGKKDITSNQANQPTKTHKIDYTKILKIMPTFKDIIVNSIDESLFKPRAESIDITAVNEKRDYFRKLDEKFYTQDIAKIISEGLGVDITDHDIPQTEDELSVKKLEYKPLIEIAQELAIENVMKHQRFETIKNKIDEDLFDLGFGVARHYTDFTEGIKIKYVDPYNYVHSSFQMDDGRDIRYHGTYESGTISELIKEAGGMSSEDKLKLKNYAIGKPNNLEGYSDDEDGARTLEYFTFAYLISEERIFKKLRKNKSVKLVDRSEDGYEPNNDNKKLTIPYNVWYEGVYVPEAKVMVKWEKIPNQVEADVCNPISPFIVYAPKMKRISERGHIRFDSMVDRAKPILDEIQKDWYKFQQLKMELRPNTAEIDVDSLNNVVLNGAKVLPQDILDLFFGRGLLLKRTLNDDGEMLPKAITENNGGINNSALQFLSGELANNLQRLRQLLGINELRDGTTRPNTKTSATVQKLLLASSNNSTNHIVNASFNISLQMAESVSLRLYDVLTTPALKDMYMNIIGSGNVELLDAIKLLPMRKFGIYFDFKPDNEERIALEQSLVNSYTRGEINVAQYNKARQIRNSKSAIRYLEITLEENLKKSEASKRANIQAQAKAQAEASIAIEQTRQQTETIKYETAKNLMLVKSQLEQQAQKEKALMDDLLDGRRHERLMELKREEVLAKLEFEEFKEDGRKERIAIQSTNTSMIADQKINKKEPINFKDEVSGIFSDISLPNTENFLE